MTDNKKQEIQEDIDFLSLNTKNVKFDDILNICKKYFPFRNKSTSHYVFKTPWQGDPFVNLQRDKKTKKMAKSYQVSQVIKALEKLKIKDGSLI